MDLRIVKTKKVIKEAFLEQRRNTPLEKVSVKAICTQALINKSTFYNHYADVFALSDELEDEVLQEGFDNFEHKDCLFTDPKRFIDEIPKIIDDQKEILLILFHNREDVMFRKLSKQLRDYYKKSESSEQDDVMLTFVISGAMLSMQIMQQEKKYSHAILSEKIAEMVSKIIS